MRTTGAVILCLLLGLPAISGCLGGGETDSLDRRGTPPTEDGSETEPDTSGEDRQAEEGSGDTTRDGSDGGGWNVTESTRVAWILGVGTGGPAGGGVTSADACPSLLIGVAENATRLEVRVRSEAVNTSEPGAGIGQMRLASPDGERHEAGPIVEPTASITIDDPASGSWEFDLRPVGPVVSQSWYVTVSLSGYGGTTTPLMLQHVCARG